MLRRERAERTRAIENPAPKDLPNAERRANLCACAMRTSSSATPNLPLQANVAEVVDYAATGCDPGAKNRAVRPRRSSPKALPAALGAYT